MSDYRLIRWLVVITIALIIINIINEVIAIPSYNLNRLINVGREANIPTWFSSMLLAIAAVYAYRVSLVSKAKESEGWTWRLLSLVLLAMSCDETAQIHECTGELLNKYVFKLQGIDRSPWVVFLGPPVLIFGMFFALKLVRYMNGSTRAFRHMVAGAFVYVVGAFVLESTINLLPDYTATSWACKIESLFEESFEMFGVIIIIMGLVEHRNFLQTKSLYAERSSLPVWNRDSIPIDKLSSSPELNHMPQSTCHRAQVTNETDSRL